MSEDSTQVRAVDLWARLRAATPARIGLPRAGASVTTGAHLAFGLAHAQARDAVHAVLDIEALARGLEARHLRSALLHTQAHDRPTFLARPDLGRVLDPASMDRLHAVERCEGGLAIVLADGLSAQAIDRHALPLLDALLPRLHEQRWSLAPIVVVRQARVAIGDIVGETLGAALVLVCIGERPGLSSPDSLGVYLTWAPRRGRTDAERNCVSNIRAAGLTYAEAAQRIAFLCEAARTSGQSGVALKDHSGASTLAAQPARLDHPQSKA